MRWTFSHGNIIDVSADVLICSANVFLNLSGGVGGEILLRHGPAMQEELHHYLAERQRRFVQQGDVVNTGPHGLPFKAVLHAVAIDGFYQTSVQAVRAVIDKSLRIAASLDARTVALTALATGYGRLPMREFAEAIVPLMAQEYPPLKGAMLCVRTDSDQADLAEAVAHIARQ